jgi:hypothetical protein
MWISPTPEPVDWPVAGSEEQLLRDYLDFQRFTLLNICAGLAGEHLASRPIPSSNLSLLGLVRHMAKVERTWFRIRSAQEQIDPLYDLALGKDHDFDDLDPAAAPDDLARLRAETLAAQASSAGLSLDQLVVANEDTLSLRMVYLHMIGEYSRHNGHADLIREAIDGATER